MELIKKVSKSLIFLVFVLILILSTSTASIFVKNLFVGEEIVLSLILLVTYLFAGAIVLSTFLKLNGVKSNIKQTSFVLLSIESGLISLFTLESILFYGVNLAKFVVLFLSVLLLIQSLMSYLNMAQH